MRKLAFGLIAAGALAGCTTAGTYAELEPLPQNGYPAQDRYDDGYAQVPPARYASGCPIVENENWQAWIDVEPYGRPILNVRGAAILPTPGYRPVFLKGETHYVHGPVQDVHLSFEPPSRPTTQVLSTDEFALVTPADQRRYRAVRVICEGTVVAQIDRVPTVY